MGVRIDQFETEQEKTLKKMALYSTFILFVIAGLRHFYMPEYFMLMMPSYLPIPLALIYISGVFQILGGIGLLFDKFRVFSAWGLLLLLIAVLPANVYLWTHNIQLPDSYTTTWPIFLRIPLHFLLMGWVYMFAKNPQNY